jgi:hypothetical protein
VLAVADAVTPVEFVDLLNHLRESLGLSYTQIGQKAGKGMSRSTAQAMMKREDLPPRRHLQLFLRACRVSSAEYTLWIRAFDRLADLNQPADLAPIDPPADQLTEDAPNPQQSQAPETSSQQSTPRRRRAQPAARAAQTHSLLALAALIAVFSGCTIAMWLFHVPAEVIVVVFGVVLVSMFSWTAVMRTAADASVSIQPLSSASSDSSEATEEESGRQAIITDHSNGFFDPPYKTR